MTNSEPPFSSVPVQLYQMTHQRFLNKLTNGGVCAVTNINITPSFKEENMMRDRLHDFSIELLTWLRGIQKINYCTLSKKYYQSTNLRQNSQFETVGFRCIVKSRSKSLKISIMENSVFEQDHFPYPLNNKSFFILQNVWIFFFFLNQNPDWILQIVINFL